MKKVPKSIWVIFDPLDGPHLYTSEKSAKREWNKWFREASNDNDTRDSFWDMSDPTEYRKALSKEDRKELLKKVEDVLDVRKGD